MARAPLEGGGGAPLNRFVFNIYATRLTFLTVWLALAKIIQKRLTLI